MASTTTENSSESKICESVEGKSDDTVIMLSDVVNHLTGEQRAGYLSKIKQLGIADPYLMSQSMFRNVLECDHSSLPDFAYLDLCTYLVHGPSPFTGKELKAYKSMEAYKYFVGGFVSCMQQWEPETGKRDFHLIMAKVNNSQKSDAPLKSWVAIKRDGDVICAHCTCMAGFEEACSHIAALLFAVESAVRHAQQKPCTSGERQWGQVAGSNATGSSVRGCDITLKNPRKRTCETDPELSQPKKIIPALSEEEKANFYESLSQSGAESAVLSILPNYARQFTPKSILLNLPPPLTSLYDKANQSLIFYDLIAKCQVVFNEMQISQTQVNHIEKETKLQTKSKLWFSMRSGRIGASRFKSASRTDPNNPSRSLIKAICYPQTYGFSTKATRWGCDHEQQARTEYEALAATKHRLLSVVDSGFHINTKYPYIGASPDAIVDCQCCGQGILEIKCPYCKADTDIEAAAEDKNFYLDKVEDKLILNKNHQYYFQVQAQLHVAERKYCDLIVWTDMNKFCIERIYPDSDFFNVNLESVRSFYINGVLPELLAKYYTTTAQTSDYSEDSNIEYCYCKETHDVQSLIKCQSDSCKIIYFHLKCIGLKNKPSTKRKWLCTDCRSIEKAKRNIV